MRKPTESQIVIGALIFFAFWLFVFLPLYYGPRDDYAAHKCSAKEIENYDFWKKTKCDPVAYFTLWLVGFTGVLAVSTIGLWIVTWRASVRQSNDMQGSIAAATQAAEAAKLQADAFIAVESPSFAFAGFKLAEYLYPNGLDRQDVKGRDPVIGSAPEFFRPIVLPTNTGKGTLRLLRMCVEFSVCRELPERPLYLNVTGLSSSIEKGQVDAWFYQQNRIFQLDANQRAGIDARTTYLWIFGFFSYIGLLKELRIVGFAMKWNPDDGNFIGGGPPTYSYDREAT